MSARTLVSLAALVALFVAGCVGSTQSNACDGLQEETQQFNLGRFIALNGVNPGGSTIQEPTPQLVAAYENYAQALGKAVPEDFDIFDENAPRIDRVVARLYLQATVLSNSDSYDNVQQAADAQSRFQEAYEELWQICGYGD